MEVSAKEVQPMTSPSVSSFIKKAVKKAEVCADAQMDSLHLESEEYDRLAQELNTAADFTDFVEDSISSPVIAKGDASPVAASLPDFNLSAAACDLKLIDSEFYERKIFFDLMGRFEVYFHSEFIQ